MKKVKFNEWIDRLNTVDTKAIPPFPKGGTNSIYAPLLTEKLIPLTGSQIKLFMVLVAGSNEYNQCPYSREECAIAMGIKYDRGNMGKMMKTLIDYEMIALFENIPTINPWLVLPSTKIPKVKATLQYIWDDVIVYHNY